MKTFFLKQADIKPEWILIDASRLPLGRLATQVSHYLMGKHRASFDFHTNNGDKVVVINAKDIRLTGKKWQQKIYFKHSLYVGGMKETIYQDLHAKKPTFIVEKAIRGMLPKNRLGRRIFKKNLKVYASSTHPHEAQSVKKMEIVPFAKKTKKNLEKKEMVKPSS